VRGSTGLTTLSLSKGSTLRTYRSTGLTVLSLSKDRQKTPDRFSVLPGSPGVFFVAQMCPIRYNSTEVFR